MAAQLISDEYRTLNTRLHEGGRYGRHGDKWADHVKQIASDHDVISILDYGCGQGSLKTALGLNIAEYDPAISEKSAQPEPAELVVCTDVMEHIEPEFLDNVLDHLASLSSRYLFAVVSTRPAVKLLEDGRNAHLIVQPEDWWRPRFEARFDILSWEAGNQEITLLASPKQA